LGEDWGPWVATAAVTAVVLLIGEITPKSLATRYPVRFSLAVAPTIWRLSLVLRPISRVFQNAARLLFRLFRLNPDHNPPGITEDDIRTLAVLGEAEGEIKATEREIIEALFELEERPVRDVMTPRVDIVALTAPVSMTAVRDAIAATGHSRFPVVDGDLDHLVGVLYAKDLLSLAADPTDDQVAALMREPYLVPESKTVMGLLSEMRARRFGFAVVLDEHGGIEGVITAKDLIAELVGEIQDEFDPGTPSVVKTGPRQWVADGRLPIEDLEAAIGIDIEDGPYATLGGRYLSLAGRIPKPGESIADDRFTYTVLRMDRRRIDRIRIEDRAAPG
ncbi:MAG: hemolysin family protein, partial [Acidimicrobiia bacterium]|nr:hemolysin family protein [Acidimicrobiia bacterium]